ncbi:MAG: CopG family transcriptional regulator [Patescibacteria group bacterium]
MLKSYIYFPDDLDKEINQIAKSQKKSKAEVVREATAKGVKVMKQETNSGLEAFRKLAEIGKKYGIKCPRDGAINHDYYLWGLPKKDTKIKP